MHAPPTLADGGKVAKVKKKCVLSSRCSYFTVNRLVGDANARSLTQLEVCVNWTGRDLQWSIEVVG